MDFETAIKLIPLYGDSRHDDLQAYVDAVSFVIENIKDEDKKTYLKIAKLQLRGEVGASVRRNELETWEELKQFLRARGDRQQSDSYLEDQLIYIKQGPKERIREFADRIEKLGHRLIIALAKSGIDSKAATLTADRRMHKSFGKGVNEPIKSILLNRKTSSFDDAVKDALSLELDLEEDRDLERKRRFQSKPSVETSTFRRDARCFKCNKMGHKAADCRSKPMHQIKAMSGSQNCFNCGKPGHYARDCRHKWAKSQSFARNPNQNVHQTYDQSRFVQQGNGQDHPMNSRHGRSQLHKSGEYRVVEQGTSQSK